MTFMQNLEGFLIVSSHPGLAKTYLCSALVSHFAQKGIDVYAMKERDFFERIRRDLDQGYEYHAVTKYLCNHQVFILDDFGSMSSNQWRQEVLFSMIDELFESRRTAIITTNVHPDRFKDFVGERGADRMLAKRNTVIVLPEAESFRKAGTPQNHV